MVEGWAGTMPSNKQCTMLEEASEGCLVMVREREMGNVYAPHL
jgi:hypothetical protein